MAHSRLYDQEARIMVVDDESDMAAMLQRLLTRRTRWQVKVCNSAEEALDQLEEWRPEVVITDVKMKGMDGLSLLNEIKRLDSSISVIIITGFGTIEMAVSAVKEGAYDFFEKPFENDRLKNAVVRALERTRLIQENRRLQEGLTGPSSSHGFVGSSPVLKRVLAVIEQVADTNATVLIRGPSGTGKELAAQAIHRLSSRRSRPMVTINCPAVPEHILESELFGYKKGAFTGATSDKEGLFLTANHSTILLDEIGDIPITIQTKLLRVLQEKEVRPLGSTVTKRIDVRVIASTNQDLEKKIRDGEFREDLFFRLNVVTITMPTLDEMREDIPELAHHFLRRYAREYGKDGLSFSREAMEYLLNRNWLGNVRELKHAVQRAVLFAKNGKVDPCDFEEERADSVPCENFHFRVLMRQPYNQAKSRLVEMFTKRYVTAALEAHGGNVSRAAKSSGMERQSFQRLMRRYEIRSGDFK